MATRLNSSWNSRAGIELIMEQQGGKPVIRLYSAHGLEGVSVALTLCEWHQELLYPQPAISGVCFYILWPVCALMSGAPFPLCVQSPPPNLLSRHTPASSGSTSP